MGSLGFALGGALAGGGAGLARVGEEIGQAQIQQKLMEMRQQYQSQLQQAGFAHQESMQGKQQAFEKGLKEEELQAGGAIARAKLQQTRELAGQHETAATARTHETAQSRRDVAAINAYSRFGSKSGTAGGVKPFSFKPLSNAATDADGKPIPGANPEQKMLITDPNTGRTYVQWGDRTYLSDPKGNPVDRFGAMIDPRQLRRAPAEAIQHAKEDPESADLFHEAYGYYPPGYLENLQSSRMGKNQTSSESVRLPSGAMYQPPRGGGGGADVPEAPEPPEAPEGPYQDPNAD